MLRQSSSKNLQQRQQELGNLSRRLQSRIGELDLICEQLQTRKEKVRSELKSPLLSVLDGGKGLKRLFAKVVSQEKMRREERNLLTSCLQTIRGTIQHQQTERDTIKKMQNEIRRLKEQALMHRDISKITGHFSKRILQASMNEEPSVVNTPEQQSELRIDFDDIPGVRKTPQQSNTKTILPRNSIKPIDAAPELVKELIPAPAILKSDKVEIRQRTLPQVKGTGDVIDQRLFSMAKAVWDPLRKQYTWVPVGIVNDVDVLKMLLQGGQTPNKILGKQSFAKKWATHQ